MHPDLTDALWHMVDKIAFTRALGIRVTEVAVGSIAAEMPLHVGVLAEGSGMLPLAVAMADQIAALAAISIVPVYVPLATLALSVASGAAFEASSRLICRAEAAPGSAGVTNSQWHVTTNEGGLVASGWATFLAGAYPGGEGGAPLPPPGSWPDLDGRAVVRGAGLADWLGLDWVGDRGVLREADHLIGAPVPPALNGGACAAALMCAACMTDVGDKPARIANATIEFMRAGRKADTDVRSRWIHSGRRAGVLSVTAFQNNDERRIAELTARLVVS